MRKEKGLVFKVQDDNKNKGGSSRKGKSKVTSNHSIYLFTRSQGTGPRSGLASRPPRPSSPPAGAARPPRRTTTTRASPRRAADAMVISLISYMENSKC